MCVRFYLQIPQLFGYGAPQELGLWQMWLSHGHIMMYKNRLCR